MPKVEISKEWSERMARLEPDSGEIAAGSPDPANTADDWHRRAAEAEEFMRAYLSAPSGDDPPVTLAGYQGPQIVRQLAGLIGRLEREAAERATAPLQAENGGALNSITDLAQQTAQQAEEILRLRAERDGAVAVGLWQAARIAESIQPSAATAVGEAHMRSFRGAIVHAIRTAAEAAS